MKKSLLILAALLLGGLGALPAFADDAANKAQMLRQGHMLALSCAACHGTEGKSPGSIARINGKSADYIRSAMLDFKNDRRPASVMNRIAKGYDDEQISLIADYFESLR